MKLKNIKALLLLITTIMLSYSLNVKADSFNAYIKCDKTATFPDDILACDLMSSGDATTKINNLYGKYEFGNHATYIKFVAEDEWDNVTVDETGFKLHSDGGIGVNRSYGKLYIRVNGKNLTSKGNVTATIGMKVNQYEEYLSTSKSITTQFIINPNNENRLDKVLINNGEIPLEFNPDTSEYSITTSKQNIKISVTTKNSLSITDIKNSYNLKEGLNKIEVKVTGSDADLKKARVYTFNVTRSDDKSDDNTLSNLEICGQKLEIKKGIDEYSINVGHDIALAIIWYKTTDNNATVTINGDTNLLIGRNIYLINVTSEKGNTKTYKVYVTRNEKNLNTNNLLSKIEIEKYYIPFKKDTNEYTLKIKDEESLNINVTTDSDTAKYQIIGNQKLKNGSTILINVTSESGETNTYSIIIEKKDSTISILRNLLIFVVILLIIVVGLLLYKWKNGGKGNKPNIDNQSKSNVLIE